MGLRRARDGAVTTSWGYRDGLCMGIRLVCLGRGSRLYRGVCKRLQNRGRDVKWATAMRPGKRRLLDRSGPWEAAEKRKASLRAKVEHPFLYVKRHFGYDKVRYRGLEKNTQRIALLLCFTNLLIAGRYATA